MAGEMIQNIVEYLKTHPEAARKVKEYVKTHPDDVRSAFKEIATMRGWDLSKIDTTALKNELGKIAA